jgi:desulfoferrodoxin (superoxide reductase-like protein)
LVLTMNPVIQAVQAGGVSELRVVQGSGSHPFTVSIEPTLHFIHWEAF